MSHSHLAVSLSHQAAVLCFKLLTTTYTCFNTDFLFFINEMISLYSCVWWFLCYLSYITMSNNDLLMYMFCCSFEWLYKRWWNIHQNKTSTKCQVCRSAVLSVLYVGLAVEHNIPLACTVQIYCTPLHSLDKEHQR